MACDFVVYGRQFPKGNLTKMPGGPYLENLPAAKCAQHGRRRAKGCAGCDAALVLRKQYAADREGYKAAIARAAREFYPAPFEGPTNLAVRFFKQHPKTGPQREWNVGKPDLDKLLRNVCDVLKSAGVVADDARFVTYNGSEKRYAKKGAPWGHPDGPRVEITVRAVLSD